MNQYLSGKGELQSEASRCLIEAYSERESQAELVIPYSYPTPVGLTFVSAWLQSRMHRFLIDIDGPWLFSFAISSVLCVTSVIWFMLSCLGPADLHMVQRVLLLGVLSWILLLTPVYYLVTLLNFKLRYRSEWLRTLMGPTHLGLSPTGIKCYWKGRFFYNYPLLRAWSNVLAVELALPDSDHGEREGEIFLSFACRINPAANIRLPLSGFRTRQHLATFLTYLKKYAPEAVLGQSFSHDSEIAFQGALETYDKEKQQVTLLQEATN